MLDKLNPLDDFFIPSGPGEVGEEPHDAEEQADAEGGDVEEEGDGEAEGDGETRLAVVGGGEEVGVLEGAVGADEGQLGAAEDGVGFEGGVEGGEVAFKLIGGRHGGARTFSDD